MRQFFLQHIRFNSQPPEGGWLQLRACHTPRVMFQLTAARRRLAHQLVGTVAIYTVSTHSRPKAAGASCIIALFFCSEFQLTAARRRLVGFAGIFDEDEAVSTHSRPKAAGSHNPRPMRRYRVSTHSRPKAAGAAPSPAPLYT